MFRELIIRGKSDFASEPAQTPIDAQGRSVATGGPWQLAIAQIAFLLRDVRPSSEGAEPSYNASGVSDDSVLVN